MPALTRRLAITPALSVVITLLLASAPAAATIRYVNDDALPGGNGLSWSTAYQRLESALAASSSGDQIWVAVGRYEPAPANGNRSLSFVLKGGVPVYGGFRGNEATLADRAGFFEDTLLSGDLNRNDGFFTNTSENSFNVVDMQQSACVLDGFNIAYGNANGTGLYEKNGGAIIATGGGSIVRNCILQVNQCSGSAAGGGAAYAAGCVFEGCTFLHNRSTGSSGGGAIFASGPVTLKDCRFQFNTCIGGSFGGGAVSVVSGELTVEGCLFQSNTADFDSSGGGGAIRADSALVINSRFLSNRADGGSGGAITGSTLRMVNCLVASNESLNGSGAIILMNGESSITNCTIASNTAPASPWGGGVVLLWGSLDVSNSILYFNSGASGQTQAGQLAALSGGVSLNYSCVHGLDGSFGGSGNIAGNPRFILPAGPDRIQGTPDDDYRIRLDSPCIDSGSSGTLPLDTQDLDGDGITNEPLPVDLTLAPRRSDDPATIDTGSGAAPVVDIGAFEFRPAVPACPADFDGSGFVDTDDFDAFIHAFETGC